MAERLRLSEEYLEEENKKTLSKMSKKKNLTFFLLIIPAFLMAMTAAISQVVVRLGIQAVLFILQIVLVKNLLDDYYGD